jgi:uncharacterized membrane protein
MVTRKDKLLNERNADSMGEKRPVLKLKYSKFEKILELAAVIFLITAILLTLLYWPSILEKIITHCDIKGNPDSYGGKGSLLIMPIVSAGIYLLITLLSRFPHSFNYIVDINEENAIFQYNNARILMLCIKAEIMCMFAYLQWRFIIESIKGNGRLGILFLPVFLIVIFGTLIYFVKKSVKNK